MATGPTPQGREQTGAGSGLRRRATETKQAFKTTEFWSYVFVFLLILIAGHTIEGEEGGIDVLDADNVWLYITILTVGYMVSRGLAKAGSRDPYTERPDNGDQGGGLGDRVRSAATVLREGEPGDTRAGEGESGPPR